MFKRSRIVCSASAALAAILFSSTVFGGAPWNGEWKLNPAKSLFSPGPAPLSQVLTSWAGGIGIRVTFDTVNVNGQTTHSEYVSRFDGNEVAWEGNPDADTAACTRSKDFHVYENVAKKNGIVTLTSKFVVFHDLQTLTVIQTGKDASGREVTNVAVYERQSELK